VNGLDRDLPKPEGALESGEGQARAKSGPDSQSRAYWQRQDAALGRIKSGYAKRSATRREKADSWKRVSYSLPRDKAQQKAREFLAKYPKSAYWSEVESWRELPDDIIEFTMRRLPSAD